MTALRLWIVSVLYRLLRWLDPPVPAPEPVLDPLDVETDRLVAAADRLPGEPTGEYKRHWVYGRLVKAFPDRKPRDIGLAIELAVQAKG